jgi:AGCS family alanine or glycine:cation symporter
VIYLFGHKAMKVFRMIYTLVIPVGALIRLEAVWLMADIFNILMVLPNLIALFFLSSVAVDMAKEYFAKTGHMADTAELVAGVDVIEYKEVL